MSGHASAMFEIRRGLCRRMVEHARNGTTDLAPGVMFNDASVYTDERRLEAEMEKLFRGLPQVVCLSSDLSEAGSYRTFDDAGVPIVVVRGKDRVLRAFLNICTHRGARLVREEEGKASGFACRFHGWSFNLEGKAAAIPQEKHFCGAVGAHKRLLAVPVAERHGLVFVRAQPRSELDLETHLGAFGAELEKLDLDESRKVCEETLTVACNWKYALDTYFENYHFAFLHKNTLAPLYPNSMSLYDTWGPHHRLVFPPREAWTWADQPEAQWLIDTIGTPYFIFPNTIVYLGSLRPDQSFVTLFRLYPRGVGETVTRMTTYAPAQLSSPEYRAEVEKGARAMTSLVRDEDYSVTGESWQYLKALPAGTRVVYGRQELAVQHLHRWIAKTLGAASPEVVTAPEEAGEPERRAVIAD